MYRIHGNLWLWVFRDWAPLSLISPTIFSGRQFHNFTGICVKLLPVDWVLDFGSSRAWLGIDRLEWEGDTAKTAAKSEEVLESKRCTILIGWKRPLRYGYLVTLTRIKQQYALLIGCIGFSSHLKIKHIDFYKWPLWYKIPMLRV